MQPDVEESQGWVHNPRRQDAASQLVFQYCSRGQRLALLLRLNGEETTSIVREVAYEHWERGIFAETQLEIAENRAPKRTLQHLPLHVGFLPAPLTENPHPQQSSLRPRGGKKSETPQMAPLLPMSCSRLP